MRHSPFPLLCLLTSPCFCSLYNFAGFYHAAFTFGHEAEIGHSKMNDDDVPTGALITFVQKGLQLLELEANLNDQGTGIGVSQHLSITTPAGCSMSFIGTSTLSSSLQTLRATSPC